MKGIRVWRPPKRVNDAAADYTENLPWGDLTDLEPPITKALCPTTESLKALIDDWDAMKLPRVPPHSLDMERGVKLVSSTKHMKSKEARNFQIMLHNEFHEREEKEKLRKKKRPQIEE